MAESMLGLAAAAALPIPTRRTRRAGAVTTHRSRAARTLRRRRLGSARRRRSGSSDREDVEATTTPLRAAECLQLAAVAGTSKLLRSGRLVVVLEVDNARPIDRRESREAPRILGLVDLDVGHLLIGCVALR